MKKLLSILLVCVLSLSIFVACGEKDEVNEEYNILTQEESKDAPEADNNTEEAEEPKKEETPKKAEKKEKPLAVSDNKEVVTSKTAPEVHIVSNGGSDNASICYHLKDCKLLKGTEHQKVTWEMIEMIQFRQCPECNPPRYADYVE